MSAAVDVRDLFRVHQTPEGDAAALQGLSLTIREHEVVTVLGPSGSGKSTFLRILAGLDRPSAGTVRVFAPLPVTVTSPWRRSSRPSPTSSAISSARRRPEE